MGQFHRRRHAIRQSLSEADDPAPSQSPCRRRSCRPHDLGMFQWNRRRQEARPPGTVCGAEALIREYGPEDAYLAARQLNRRARSSRSAAHWRRVARILARIDRHGLGVDRRDDRVRLGCQEAKQVICRPSLLEPPDRRPARPDASEECKGPTLVERDPDRRPGAVRLKFVLREAGERNDAAALDAEPSAPTWRGDVSDVGDAAIRVSTLQGEDRRRHASAGHRKLSGAIFHIAHDRREIVGEDAGDWREIACGVSERTREFAYRLRAFSDGVEAAHGSEATAPGTARRPRTWVKIKNPAFERRLAPATRRAHTHARREARAQDFAHWKHARTGRTHASGRCQAAKLCLCCVGTIRFGRFWRRLSLRE